MAAGLLDPEEVKIDDAVAATSASPSATGLPDAIIQDLPTESIPLRIELPDQGLTLDDYIGTQGWTPAQIKESGAKHLATALVWIFGASIFFVLISATVVIGVQRNAEEAEIYARTLISLLEALGAFSSAVFAPLLAFILGYYFGEKQQQ